jgi:hypothetical protein
MMKTGSRNRLFVATKEKVFVAEGQCCQCGLWMNLADGTPVTWRCIACKGYCCRQCTLVDPVEKTYYAQTYCSTSCKDAYLVQCKILELPDPED